MLNYRPVTRAYATEETNYLDPLLNGLPGIVGGQGLTVYRDYYTESLHKDVNRNLDLEDWERSHLMARVFEACGVETNFHNSMIILKTPRDINQGGEVPVSTQFQDEQPPVMHILQWLGDCGPMWDDEPNDFDVGFAMEGKEHLVVCRFKSFDCGGDEYSYETEIALHPKDNPASIIWETGWN